MNLSLTKSSVKRTILLSPAKVTVKCMGKEPRYKEILVTTNTKQKPKRIIYPDITNKGQHVTKDNCVTDQQESKSFNSVTTEQLPSSQLIINANADTIDTFTDPLYPFYLLLVLLTLLFLKASCGKRWYYAWKFLPNSHLPFRPTFYVNCRFLFKKDSIGDNILVKCKVANFC